MKVKILISYWYYKNTNLDEVIEKYFPDDPPEIFADSGAYSAMTQGVDITIDEYAEWVNKWKHRFFVYANLDVIMDAEKTWENQLILEGMGLNPLPAFHVNEEFDWLERYIEKYPYIALGVAGMQGRKEAIMRWLVKCFQMAEGKSVLHGFGLTSWKVMKSFPWFSVDSSSWGAGFRYGRVPLFSTRDGRFYIVPLGDYQKCKRQSRLFSELGFDWMDFADRSRNQRQIICAISALSYKRAEEWLVEKWGTIEIPGREGSGVNIHLVTGSGGNMSIKSLHEGVNLYLAESTSELKDVISAKDYLNDDN